MSLNPRVFRSSKLQAYIGVMLVRLFSDSVSAADVRSLYKSAEGERRTFADDGGGKDL